MKSVVLVLLLTFLLLGLLLASPVHPSPIQASSSSPGGDLEILSAENVIVVDRKGGNGSDGRGGTGAGSRGAGGRARLIPFYGGTSGSRRSSGKHHSGSDRFLTNINLKLATLLFTAILAGI